MALEDEWNDEAEQRHAMAMIPFVREVMDYCKAKFPPSTDFGVMLLVKPVPGQEYGRVIAMTTDRERVAPPVAQWALQVMRGMEDKKHG